MFSNRSMRPAFLTLFVILSLLVAACGGGSDGDGSDTGDETANTGGSNQTDDGGASGSSDGGDPVGTATIDGIEYTIVGSLQCLVALDQANQISISGDVEEYESSAPYEWQYDWDSDDGYNEFSITLGDDMADEYRGFGTFSDPQVSGDSVSASGTVTNGTDTLDASFEIDCAS